MMQRFDTAERQEDKWKDIKRRLTQKDDQSPSVWKEVNAKERETRHCKVTKHKNKQSNEKQRKTRAELKRRGAVHGRVKLRRLGRT